MNHDRLDGWSVPAPLSYGTREPKGVRLRPVLPLPYVWLPLGAIMMAVGLSGCLRYNSIAGTDLTAPRIAGVMASVHLGPFAGPLHSNSASCEGFYLQLIPVPLAALVAGWLPFFLTRRPVHWALAVAAWVFHVLAAATWYGAALLSLAYWLS